MDRDVEGGKRMRATTFILAGLTFLSSETWTYAQVSFGKPVAAETESVSQSPQLPIPRETQPQGNQGIRDEFGLAPPTRAQLFQVQSEQSQKEVLRQELRQELPNLEKVEFPADAKLPSQAPGAGQTAFPQQFVSPVPNNVCYRPLYFEDKATERFGHYVPYAQPFLSAGCFYGDVIILPYRVWQTPPWTFECDNR